LAWHNYSKQPTRPRHWDDHDNAAKLESLSVQRIQYLLAGTEPEDSKAIQEIDRFGLGHERTMDDYQSLAKVDFKKQKVLETEYVRNGRRLKLFKA